MGRQPAGKGQASMRRIGTLADGGHVPETPSRSPRSGPKRIQDAQTVDEALEIERDTGRAEGVKSNQKRPITRYGPEGKPRADAPRPPTKSTGDRARSVLSSPKGVTHDGAGAIVGLLAYALFSAYLNGGWSGVSGWLGAKFLNKTTTGSNPTAQNPGGFNNNDTTGNEAWIKAHLGRWPHPGAGSSDFWNAAAQQFARTAGVPMQGKP
jgi:hypothetical protein